MRSYLLPSLLVSGVMLAASGCNRTTNPVFTQYPPSTKQYADELARQLKLVDKSTLTYRLDAYHEQGSARQLLVRLQGEGLCAQLPLTIKSSLTGIEQLVAAKGVGYRNAELKNLRFTTQQDSAKTEFIFAGADGVID